jgi:hypothetical protein
LVVGEPIQMKRVPWQRLSLSLLGIVIMVALWRWSVNHLYTLPPTSIAAFTSITTNCYYAVAVLVVFFVSGQLVWSWINSTSSSVIQEASTAIGYVPKPKYFDSDEVQ